MQSTPAIGTKCNMKTDKKQNPYIWEMLNLLYIVEFFDILSFLRNRCWSNQIVAKPFMS